MRRKQLGYVDQCFYCPETDLSWLEQDHPVTEGLDKDFKRVVCAKCHRKLEFSRDTKRLTKNGQREVNESPVEALQRYLLLLAEDEDSQAELLQETTATRIQFLIRASQARAASLRRKAQDVSLFRSCA